MAGMKPVYIDCSPDSVNIDPSLINSSPVDIAITPSLFGIPFDARSITNIPVIEAIAQSFGSFTGSMYTGTLGSQVYYLICNQLITSGGKVALLFLITVL